MLSKIKYSVFVYKNKHCTRKICLKFNLEKDIKETFCQNIKKMNAKKNV